MSLIEKAIRKLQESGGSPPGPALDARPAAAPLIAPAGVEAPAARMVRGVPMARHTTGPVLPLNFAALREAGLLAPDHRARQVGQLYRKIKRPLIANAIGQGVPAITGGQLILVASALPGDGKSFTSLNLALSIAAERDLNVLLVDADVAKPQLSRLFGLEGAPGLLELLRDESLAPESIVRPTTMPGLALLPAGAPSADATELLGSARMEAVCASLAAADRARMIVFDSPPLLLATESHALAQCAGQVVVVVRSGVTLRADLEQALDHVRARPFVGLVLNQSLSAAATSYGYYYGDSATNPPT